MANPTGGYLALKKLWHQLPQTMRTDCDRNQIGDPALKRIIELCELYEGDYAGAKGRLTTLLSAGALKARKCEDGWLELIKGPFPDPNNPQDWVAQQNARIQREVAATEARWAYEEKTAKENRAVRDAPIVNAQRADFLFMMKEAGLDSASLAAKIETAVEARG